jgi:UDP-N-acetylglucosamine:LPS N-acetylglucosamine transferase
MIKNKRKYLLFYLKTGGGHFAPASSLSNYLKRQHASEVSPVLIDGFERTNRIVKNLIEEGYRHLQSKAKWMYEVLYAFNKIPLFARISCFIVSKSSVKFIKDRITEENPEKIVILHFFLIEPVYEAVRKLKLSIPVYTLVTDPFTAHPMWFLRKDQQFIVFSEKLKKSMTHKIPADRIYVFPFILDEKFSQPVPASAIRGLKIEMGFEPERKIILILGGGDGIPQGRLILEKILASKPDAEIAVVCGKNRSFYNAAVRLKEKNPGLSVKVYEFISFVYELLNISDMVITKCGASTMMEILILNKVPVVNNYLWEQEKGNIEFIRDNGLGIYEKNISQIPGVVKRLIEDDEFYGRFRKNIASMDIKNGVADVAEFLISDHNIARDL